ncbi:MAG: TIGR02996 domain-containing protein [Kofleriaceae bacterium]
MNATAPGLDAARAGDWSRCLDELLYAWRHHRTPDLAALIERVGKRAGVDEIDHAPTVIRKHIARLTNADISPLISAIMRHPTITPALIGLACELAAAAPPDPRIADLLDDLYDHDELNQNLVAQIARHDDPRTRDRLLVAAEHWAKHKQHRADDVNFLLATVKRIPAVESSLTVDFSPYDELLAPDRTHAHLLAAVYDDPSSDHARLVYADALQDAGDPRGELITLQLTNPGTQRERSLLKKHGRAWTGSLANDLRASGLVYRRGFPAAGRLALMLETPRSHADRGWSTFEEIDLVSMHGPALARWLATLPALRRVSRFNAHDLLHLPETLPWTHLGLVHTNSGVTRHLSHFPALEELDLTCVDQNDAVQFAIAAPLPKTTRVRLRALDFIPDIPRDHIVVFASEYEFPPIAKAPTVEIHRIDNQFHARIICKKSVDLDYPLRLLRNMHQVKSATLVAWKQPDPIQLELLQTLVTTTLEIHRASTDRPAP